MAAFRPFLPSRTPSFRRFDINFVIGNKMGYLLIRLMNVRGVWWWCMILGTAWRVVVLHGSNRSHNWFSVIFLLLNCCLLLLHFLKKQLEHIHFMASFAIYYILYSWPINLFISQFIIRWLFKWTLGRSLAWHKKNFSILVKYIFFLFKLKNYFQSCFIFLACTQNKKNSRILFAYWHSAKKCLYGQATQETLNLHKMWQEEAGENTSKATAMQPLHQYSINMQKRTNKLDCITINRVLRVPLSIYLRVLCVNAVCTYLNASKTNCSGAKLASTTLTVNVDAHAQPSSSHALMPRLPIQSIYNLIECNTNDNRHRFTEVEH